MASNTVKVPEKGSTRFVAHRGVSGLECENTAAAFIAAGNRTYYGVETDIWRTSDGKFLCTCFIAFNIENLDLVKKLRPEQECQFLTGEWNDNLPEMLSERKMGLDIHYGQLTEERIRACHKKGVEVNCWTVDKPEEAEKLISWGIDYITTNILE